MLSGPPLPLFPDTPLAQLFQYLGCPGRLGAWVRQSTRTVEIRCSKGRLLVGPDLGLLLRRCTRIVLREGCEPVVVEADRLIECRALQVITGTPCLPGLERLRAWFPGLAQDPTGFSIPITTRSSEEVLADCVRHGIQVAGSRVVYHPHPSAAPPHPCELASSNALSDRGGIPQWWSRRCGEGEPISRADYRRHL